MANANNMDDILASIRKMIAEEPQGQRAAPVAAPVAAPAAPAASAPVMGVAAVPDARASEAAQAKVLPSDPAPDMQRALPVLEAVAPSWGNPSTERTFGPAIGPQAGSLPKHDPDRHAAFPLARDGLARLIDDTAAQPAMPLVRPSDTAVPGDPMSLPAAPLAREEPSLTDRLLERLGAAAHRTETPVTAAPFGSLGDRAGLFDGAPPPRVEPRFEAQPPMPDLGQVRPGDPMGDLVSTKSVEPSLASLLSTEPKPAAGAASSVVVPTPVTLAVPLTPMHTPAPMHTPMPVAPPPSGPAGVPAPPSGLPEALSGLAPTLETTGSLGVPPPAVAPMVHDSGGPRTFEDTVADMLRPMLKTWLDQNLPGIVEKAVRDHLATRHSA